MGVSNKQLMSSGSNANNDVVVVYEKAIDRGLVQKTLEQQGQILKTGNNSDTSGRGDSLTCSSSPPRNDQLTLPPTYQNATMFRKTTSNLQQTNHSTTTTAITVNIGNFSNHTNSRTTTNLSPNTSIRDNPSQISGAINPYQIHPSTLRNFQITKNFASLNNKNNDRKISKSSRVKQLNNKFHQDLQNFEKEVKKLSLDRDLSDISPVSQSLNSNSNSENSQTSPDTGRETHESSESQKNSQNSTTKLKIQKSMLPPKNPRKQQVDLNVSQISASCNENCLTDGHSDNCWLNSNSNLHSTQPIISAAANPFLRGRNNHSNSVTTGTTTSIRNRNRCSFNGFSSRRMEGLNEVQSLLNASSYLSNLPELSEDQVRSMRRKAAVTKL